MRNAFAHVMTELAEERKDICLLSGDIGNRMFDKYKGVAPERFLNCGIAEANMMSVAAGMALDGLRPVIYTITPFTTTRCLEQIRVGACYHEAPVLIIGTGSGLSYSELGPTHHSLEDLSIIRSLPGINVLAPADPHELVAQVRESVTLSKPTYIRIGKKGEPDLNSNAIYRGIGKARKLREGRDVAVLGIGPILHEVLDAAASLSERNISVDVTSMGSVFPIDEDYLATLSKQFSLWITIEEHDRQGGLGSAIYEWNEASRPDKRLEIKRMGTPHSFIHELGDQKYTRSRLGLDASGIASFIEHELKAIQNL